MALNALHPRAALSRFVTAVECSYDEHCPAARKALEELVAAVEDVAPGDARFEMALDALNALSKNFGLIENKRSLDASIYRDAIRQIARML